MDKFGKLSEVKLREYWTNEAKDFTPWLSKEENLRLLADALQMTDLELEGREQLTGDFYVDILARDGDRYVVIENQLERTDHKHLGQLLTYAAGQNAKAIVWIAKEIREEHRRALDWLNENSLEELRFFGVEMELWRIGDSKPAPKFNIVSKPNDWAKTVQPAVRTELTETKLLQREFWEGLKKYMEDGNTGLRLKQPQPQNYYEITIGRSGFHISLTVNSFKKRIGCELYIQANFGFRDLQEEKEDIERELSAGLEWQDLPGRKAARIAQYKKEVDFRNREKWPRLFEWFKERAEAFYETFSPRVKDLNPDEEKAA